VKRNALVPAFCALLLTNMIVAANPRDLESLAENCSNGDRKACQELAAAVRNLNDQTSLAKIAVEVKDPYIRKAAVEKLKDQVFLAKIAVEDEAPIVCGAAVGKLTDQTALAKVAIEARYNHELALRKLTDQTSLAKVAAEAKDPRVRSAAVGKLTDQSLLARLAEKGEDRLVRAKAIAAMNKSNPDMRSLAGDLVASTTDAGESIARVRLAIEEPSIRNRLPRIVFVPSVSDVYQSYSGFSVWRAGMQGESVSFVLSQDRKTLTKKSWSTNFPGQTQALTFLAAKVHGGDLLGELLGDGRFTQDDLVELCSSEIPEVRQAAVGNLTDQALLAKIAAEDNNANVRRVAEQSLAGIRTNAK
jgi:hypothetical protein